MLSLTDSFTVLRLSENFAPPNLSDYLRASAAASIFFFPASCLAMSLQVQPAGGLNTRVTLCLFGLCASRINPAHFRVLVGLSGLEPPTSRLSGVRSNRLSYKPIFPASRLSGHPATVAVPLLLRSSGASFDSPASLRRFPSLRFSAGQNRALPVVEINGIEPLTSCLQSRRSPS